MVDAKLILLPRHTGGVSRGEGPPCEHEASTTGHKRGPSSPFREKAAGWREGEGLGPKAHSGDPVPPQLLVWGVWLGPKVSEKPSQTRSPCDSPTEPIMLRTQGHGPRAPSQTQV